MFGFREALRVTMIRRLRDSMAGHGNDAQSNDGPHVGSLCRSLLPQAESKATACSRATGLEERLFVTSPAFLGGHARRLGRGGSCPTPWLHDNPVEFATAAALPVREQIDTQCCHTRANEYWTVDPQGPAWAGTLQRSGDDWQPMEQPFQTAGPTVSASVLLPLHCARAAFPRIGPMTRPSDLSARAECQNRKPHTDRHAAALWDRFLELFICYHA